MRCISTASAASNRRCRVVLLCRRVASRVVRSVLTVNGSRVRRRRFAHPPPQKPPSAASSQAASSRSPVVESACESRGPPPLAPRSVDSLAHQMAAATKDDLRQQIKSTCFSTVFRHGSANFDEICRLWCFCVGRLKIGEHNLTFRSAVFILI